MTSENFCYWLQGFFEITNTDVIYGGELDIIKEHLNLVLTLKENPQVGISAEEAVRQLTEALPLVKLPPRACANGFGSIGGAHNSSFDKSTLIC